MTFKTIPVCERCWIEKYTTTEGIKIPSFVMDGQNEICGFCGSVTIVGIYSREKIDEEKAQVPMVKLPRTTRYKKIHVLEYDSLALRRARGIGG